MLIAEWEDMLADLEEARSTGAAELILLDYRQGIDARLAARILHSPLPKGAA